MSIADEEVLKEFDPIFDAGHGEDALDRLRERGAADLAIVDWNLPLLDRLDVPTALPADTAHQRMKVILLTTESEATKVARVTAAGADEYLVKPWTSERLRSKLDATVFAGPEGHPFTQPAPAAT
jgi:two-component system chemotaxis response regulator CheY